MLMKGVSNEALWVSNEKVWVSNEKLWISNEKLWVSNENFWVSNANLRCPSRRFLNENKGKCYFVYTQHSPY